MAKRAFSQQSAGRSNRVGHCGNIHALPFASMTPSLSSPRIVICVPGMQTGAFVRALQRKGIERVRGDSG